MDYNPPGALSSKGWRLFDKEFKERAPIRHWIKKDFRKTFILPIKWKYESINHWIRYRTYDRYHIVDTGLKPGYHEIDTLMLHSNFNMLKDFIEVEQAKRSYYWSDEYEKDASWCEKHMPFYRRFYPFRRPDLGIKHLEWASTLDDPALPLYEQSPTQARAARESLALYNWWVNDRPARKEIEYVEYNDQGLGYLASLDDDFDKEAPDFKAHCVSAKSQFEQADSWEEEDTEMLVRLMKIRKSLWT